MIPAWGIIQNKLWLKATSLNKTWLAIPKAICMCANIVGKAL